MTEGFTTVYGRNLVAELPAFVHRPYLVVTMDDLWPLFEAQLGGPGLAGVHAVRTLDVDELEAALSSVPACASVIGLGGGQAVDVAKFVAWRRRLPLFQVPTAMTVNAPFGHRAGLRRDGLVRYLGYAVPEAVYVDFDVISSAPAGLNRAGVGDVLCYHTAHLDWRLTRDLGREERQWPYDARLVDEARQRLDSVLGALDDIHDVTDAGIRTLMDAHRWGGQTFHAAGWNPRHIEGIEHFFFYNLERLTGRHLVAALARAGVDIRPQAMGVTWIDAVAAMRSLGEFVRTAGLWHSIADERAVDDGIEVEVRDRIDAAYGEWDDAS
jgi:glycerol-1-phosphate dehydrogenase [NAD(P)+]